MKKFLFTLLFASGLLALIPMESKAITVIVGAPAYGYYGNGYYGNGYYGNGYYGNGYYHHRYYRHGYYRHGYYPR
jgi:hypothetical protein